MHTSFEWDEKKNLKNIEKHGVSFEEAERVFGDSKRIIIEDLEHSKKERRYFCIGKVGKGILTVRFIYRERKIRIFGAGYWRRGKERYEKEKTK
ncbi:MAG: hypothetical protein ACD_32C00046G0005 [uncultured bacterium]|nr:MAG: hypothetical protein ACD_32C00046G0005 [uncultured bacterium]